jgi:hypothetical protein
VKWLLARAVGDQTVVFTRVFSGKARAINADEKVNCPGAQTTIERASNWNSLLVEAKFPIFLKKFPVCLFRELCCKRLNSLAYQLSELG